MRKVHLHLLTILLLCATWAAVSGCAQKKHDDAFSDNEENYALAGFFDSEEDESRVMPYSEGLGDLPQDRKREESNPADWDYRTALTPHTYNGKSLIKTARSALGTRYVFGGTTTAGFDCSGFVRWSYQRVGINLPRTAREQSQIGRRIARIDDLRVGDIVSFRRRGGYHTGIYLGDRKFIHSPRTNKRVEITSIDTPYFRSNFLFGRRVKGMTLEERNDAKHLLAMHESGKLDSPNHKYFSERKKSSKTLSGKKARSFREIARSSKKAQSAKSAKMEKRSFGKKHLASTSTQKTSQLRHKQNARSAKKAVVKSSSAKTKKQVSVSKKQSVKKGKKSAKKE
ncbi:MAG: C40 family peptidase [Desulfovibrionaceae bacterium]|nr:C40 family peptidase [Desulfovibrionaceae bacterium]